MWDVATFFFVHHELPGPAASDLLVLAAERLCGEPSRETDVAEN